MRLLFVNIFIIIVYGKSFNMGPYKVDMLSIHPCPSTRLNESGNYIINIINHKNGSQDIEYEGQIFKSIGPLGVKVVSKQLSDENNKENKTLITSIVPNICSNVITRTYARAMQFLDSKCYLIPGRIQYKIRDINKFIHLLFAKHFFYYKFSTNIVLLAAKNPVSCLEVITRTVPA